MRTIKSFKDLEVYKVSLQLLRELYDVGYKVPHIKLRTQLFNSAEAIAPLIAEGYAKQRNPLEAARFYEMAMAESDEVTVHLTKAIILNNRFSRIPQDKCRELKTKYTLLSKRLNRLSSIWRSFSSKRKSD